MPVDLSNVWDAHHEDLLHKVVMLEGIRDLMKTQKLDTTQIEQVLKTTVIEIEEYLKSEGDFGQDESADFDTLRPPINEDFDVDGEG